MTFNTLKKCMKCRYFMTLWLSFNIISSSAAGQIQKDEGATSDHCYILQNNNNSNHRYYYNNTSIHLKTQEHHTRWDPGETVAFSVSSVVRWLAGAPCVCHAPLGAFVNCFSFRLRVRKSWTNGKPIKLNKLHSFWKCSFSFPQTATPEARSTLNKWSSAEESWED